MPRSRSPRRAREEQSKSAGKFERHADVDEQGQEPEKSPDHSRPRQGPVVEKPREWAGWEIRPPRPPDKRSPPRKRSRSPPRRRSPIRRRSRSPLGRRHLPPMYNRGPGVPDRRGPPPDMRRPENKARGSGNRGRSLSPRARSPGRGGWRPSRRSPLPRGRSPRGAPPPDLRRPASPRRSSHHGSSRRHSGDRRGAPPPIDTNWSRPRSPLIARSRSPLGPRHSPRGSRASPPVPRVPRDRRSPPRVAPPRPKHLRTPPPSSSQPTAQSPSPSPRRERREERRSVEREKYGREKDREGGRGRELPSIPDEEADMSKSNTMTGVSCDWAVFRGPEMGEIDPREMKKIQIDIRRNLPPGKAKSGLIVDRSRFRDLGDPALLGVPRRPNEGRRQLFDRDEIRQAEKQDEEQAPEEPRVKVILEPLQEYERKLGSKIWEDEDDEEEERRSRRRTREEVEDRIPATERLGEKRRRSPGRERRRSEERELVRGDVRDRLGGRERSPIRERRHVKERLGEVVGRGEDERHRGRGRGGYRGRGRGRGGGHGGHHFNKYEKFEGQQEEPTSTTD